MVGSGGRLNFGRPGMVGKLGIGRDGWVVGNVGSVGCGRFGIEGNGGSVGSCRRLRAARLTSMLEIVKTTTKAKNKHLSQVIKNLWLAYAYTWKERNSIDWHCMHSISQAFQILWPLPSANNSICKPHQWRGSDDYKFSDQFLEPVRWKRYSNVCISAVRHDANWLHGDSSGVYTVTGVQLISKGKWPRSSLHLFTQLYNLEDRMGSCTKNFSQN
ncbi:hypothetical protein Dsin_032246 [Dipteronia sinensis]|uniref:Uncharacterized protein n=1 Tax=Dipteronia sinensis TaxID=43782 RepID=A0AAD9ZN27_9ROSI|nr:hypothetical protein Dsin_032246 [Dipteronia sinensis]